MKTELWEILVPTTRRVFTGTETVEVPCRTRFHRVWDAHVRGLCGGLTIHRPAKGQWVDGETTYTDRVIPVRIACSREQIENIINFTIGMYNQEAVMAYKVSEEVLIIRADGTSALPPDVILL